MRRIVLAAISLLLHTACLCQDGGAARPSDSTRNSFTRIFKALSIGMTDVSVDCYIPFRNHRLLSMPDGTGSLLYYTGTTTGETAYFFPFSTESKLCGLYYKQRFGLELYYASYQLNNNSDVYTAYLQQRYANYYIYPSINGGADAVQYVDQLMYGITYLAPLGKRNGKYFFIPKLLVGLERHSSQNLEYASQFKEKGANSFVSHYLSQALTPTGPVCEGQVNLAWRPARIHPRASGKPARDRSKHFILESGLRLKYVYVPYRITQTETVQPFGQSATITHFDHRYTEHIVSVGIYLTAYYLTKKLY